MFELYNPNRSKNVLKLLLWKVRDISDFIIRTYQLHDFFVIHIAPTYFVVVHML